jgi:hypothetical protein
MSEQHPAGTPDERPRPQYGEYAPEGWTWQPPAEDRHSDAPAPPPQAAPEPAPAAVPAAAASVEGRADRPVDRLITIMLLVLGVFGAWSAIATIQSLPDQLPQAIRQAGELLGTGAATFDYTPGPEVPGILLVGSIAQVVLWLLTAWWSVSRIRARRLAFWVPLVGGVISFALLYAVMFVIVIMDPALVESLSQG